MMNKKKIREEIKTWTELVDTLTYPHQQVLRLTIWQHIAKLKDMLTELSTSKT